MADHYEKNIDFRSILEKLHQKALSVIGKRGMRFTFQDTAFAKDKFTSPGEHLLLVVFNDRGMGEQQIKANGLGIIHDYLQNMTGTDFKGEIKKEHLFDISTTLPEDDGVQGQTDDGNVAENTFMTRGDRILSEDIERIFEDATNSENQKTIGCAIGYTISVGTQQGGVDINKSVASLGGGFMDGTIHPDEISIKGMDASPLSDVKKFVSAINISSPQILSNLHAAASAKAAKAIGIKTGQHLNQFIINSGITDDGRTVSDSNEGADYRKRFADRDGFDVGVVMVFKGDPDGDEGEFRSKDLALKGIHEYLKWFCGDDNIEDGSVVQFSPQYSGGRTMLDHGRILSSQDTSHSRNAQIKSDNGANRENRVGYKVGCRIEY